MAVEDWPISIRAVELEVAVVEQYRRDRYGMLNLLTADNVRRTEVDYSTAMLMNHRD